MGIAAREAEKNGASAIADRNANASNHAGSCASAIAPKHSAAAPSDASITRRRSNRSLRCPANGPTRPSIPNVSSRVADSQIAEPSVRSKIVAISAVYAAAPPATEISRETARRRTAERDACG